MAPWLINAIRVAAFEVLRFMWDRYTERTREKLAAEQLEKEVLALKARYEALIKDAEEKMKDGLTKEEIDEIRKGKIEIEPRLLHRD